MSDPKPGLAARHPDLCPVCQHDINPGDRIVFRRGRPIHVACHGGQDE